MNCGGLRVPLVVFVVAVCTVAAGAQQSSTPVPAGRGGITGTVVDAVTNQPIPSATVTLSADGNRTRISVSADDQGRFVFSDVPAGRLFLSSNTSGYTNGYYGIRSPNAANQWFDLADGETASGVVIRMWKNPVVSGTVTDASNDPVVGASVMAARLEIVGGRRTIGRGRQVKTDDRGMYRLIDLTPGEFAIVLVSPANTTPTVKDQSRPVYPTLFYPDTTSPSRASLLTLNAGDERDGIDFHVTTWRAPFSVSGVVTGRAEGRSGPLQLNLRPAEVGRIPANVDVRRVSADAQGRFTFPAVMPGAYVIEAIDVPMKSVAPGTSRMTFSQTGTGISFRGWAPSLGSATPPLAPLSLAPTLWANVPVTVDDRNLDDVAVSLQPGAHIAGRVVFDGNAERPGAPSLLSTPVMPMSADGLDLGLFPASGLRPDGSFKTAGLPPGQYRLMMLLMNAPQWSLASIDVNGVEMVGQPLTLGGADLANVVFTFIDRPTQLSGTVRSDAGKPTSEATVYVFSTDRRAWEYTDVFGANSREIRPARTGIYQTALLPGEYFVAAVEATAREDWRRADVLELLAGSARIVRIERGQSVTLDLAVPKGK